MATKLTFGAWVSWLLKCWKGNPPTCQRDRWRPFSLLLSMVSHPLRMKRSCLCSCATLFTNVSRWRSRIVLVQLSCWDTPSWRIASPSPHCVLWSWLLKKSERIPSEHSSSSSFMHMCKHSWFFIYMYVCVCMYTPAHTCMIYIYKFVCVSIYWLLYIKVFSWPHIFNVFWFVFFFLSWYLFL